MALPVAGLLDCRVLTVRSTFSVYDSAGMIMLGLMFMGVALVFILMDWGGLSKRMPTQVPSRTLASVPLALGFVLVVAGALS